MEETEKLINAEDENEVVAEPKNKFAKDQLFLNPLEKYAIYNKFPFGLTIHLILVIFLIYRVIGNIPENEEQRHFKHLLYETFLPLSDDNGDKDKTGLTYQEHLYIYNMDQLKTIVKTSLNNYFNIEDLLIENITYMDRTNTSGPAPPKMYVNYIKGKKNAYLGQAVYDLTLDDLGPLDNTDGKKFMNNITSFSIVYNLQAIFPKQNKFNELKCIGHQVEQIYSMDNYAIIDLYLNYDKIQCKGYTYIGEKFWTEVIIIIFAIISLVYIYFHVIKRYKYYHLYKLSETKKYERENTLNNKHKDNFDKEDMLFNYLVTRKKSLKKNYKIIDFWTLIVLLGNAFQIIGATLTICDPYHFNNSTGFINSLGAVMSLLIFIKYMDNLGSCSIIYDTLKRGLSPSMNYLIGILPVFIGFSLFGKCVFWRSEYFVTLKDSFAVLYALMNGDSVYGIFDDIIRNDFVLGTIFCYSFTIIFIAIIMNIFLSIIGEAFVTKKEKKYKTWIYQVLQMEEKEKTRKRLEDEEIEADKNKPPKELLKYKLGKIYEEFDNVQKLSVLIIGKSTTKNIVELRSKFGEQLSVLDLKMDSIKKSIKLNPNKRSHHRHHQN